VFLKIRRIILSARIEWHWHHIMLGRKKQNSLLYKGATFNSPSFLRANSSLDYHSVAVMKLTSKFKELAQLSQNQNWEEEILCKQS